MKYIPKSRGHVLDEIHIVNLDELPKPLKDLMLRIFPDLEKQRGWSRREIEREVLWRGCNALLAGIEPKPPKPPKPPKEPSGRGPGRPRMFKLPESDRYKGLTCAKCHHVIWVGRDEMIARNLL